MWQAFKDDIELRSEDGGFKNREEYENWVRGWVEDSISECGRIERWALKLGDGDATDELNIKIGEDNG